MAGLVPAALQLGLRSLVESPWRGIVSQRPQDSEFWFSPLQPDVVVEEKHNDSVEITDHPVENSVSVTDHSYRQPRELTITYGWSESPKGLLSWQSSVGLSALSATVATDAVGSALSAQAGRALGGMAVIDILSGVSKVNSAYDLLLKVQSQRELIAIYTGRQVYTNMLIKSLSLTNDKDSAYSATIDIVAREVVLVTTQSAQLTGDAAALLNKGTIYAKEVVRKSNG